jgi:hypothetical protein
MYEENDIVSMTINFKRVHQNSATKEMIDVGLWNHYALDLC